jgi:hypothetical protein
MAIMEGTFHAVIGRTHEYVSGGAVGAVLRAAGWRSPQARFLQCRQCALALHSLKASVRLRGSGA